MNINKSRFPVLVVLLALLLLTGCAALVSKRIDPNILCNPKAKPTEGNAFYYLPKVELMLTAVLTNAPSTSVLASTVNEAATNISSIVVSNSFAQAAGPQAALTLAVSTSTLMLGTSSTNSINLTSTTNQINLVPQTNGVILTANNSSSISLALPQGTNLIGNITIVTTTNSISLSDALKSVISLAAGTNYFDFSPQGGGVCYLVPNSGPPAWSDTNNFLTLSPGTNQPAAPSSGPTTPVTTTFNETISVNSTNWTTVPSTNWFYAITVTNFFTPEPRGLFALNIAPDYLGQYSETYGIQVDNNGFIESVNASNADQTAQIITEIAQTVASIAGLPPGVPVPAAYGPGQVLPTSISVIFDPTSAQSVSTANALIASQFADHKSLIAIHTESSNNNPLSSPDLGDSSYLAQYTEPFCGVAYRPLKPFIVDVVNSDAQFGPSLQQYLVMSPNQSPVLSVPITRASFVTRTTALTFNDGLFVGANYSRPSQAAAIFALPATIIGTYLSTITNLLQLKLNIATGQAAIQQQNLGLASATTNLLQAEQLLAKLQASTNSTAIPKIQ